MREYRSNTEYLKSISNELNALKDRVRLLIGDAHWGEEGKYKEIVLINYLKGVLPSYVSVGSGLIKGKDAVSPQIDVLIYLNNMPIYFKEGDFVIIPPQTAIAAIEVKSLINSENVVDAINHLYQIKQILSNDIFYGLFGYGAIWDFNTDVSLPKSIKKNLVNIPLDINCIAFGSKIFCRFWHDSNPHMENNRACYSFYELGDLTAGYFISNLISYIYDFADTLLEDSFYDFLFPILKTKEYYRINQWQIYR